MTVSFNERVAEALPYTVGDGAPVYRTNPTTKQRWSFAELTQMAHNTQKTYNVDMSAYIQEEQHKFSVAA